MAFNILPKIPQITANRKLRRAGFLKGREFETPVPMSEIFALPEFSFEVEKQPVFSGSGVHSPAHAMIVRKDTNAPLSIMGADYGVIQFAEIHRALQSFGEFVDLKFSRAYSFAGGRRFLLGLDLGEKLEFGDDVTNFHIYIGGSFDGTKQHYFMPMSFRAACENQFHSGIAYSMLGKHTSGVNARLNIAHSDYLKAIKGIQKQKEDFARLIDAKIDDDFLTDIITATFGECPETGKGRARWENRAEEITTIFHGETCAKLSGKNRFTAFNAITEHMDHYATVHENDVVGGKKVRRSEEDIWLSRFESNVYGVSATRKMKAFDFALTGL